MDTPRDNSTDVGRRVYLETFGCQMNQLDSELVTGQLKGLGYRFVDDRNEADVVLYNTCSVRDHAEQKVSSRLGELKHAKASRPNLVVGVLGCMAEREGQAMLGRFPQVDLLCGPGELDKVPMLIDNAVKTAYPDKASRVALQGDTHRRSTTMAAAEDQLELLDLSRSMAAEDHHGSAYVRITRGCNKFCTYCVVPQTRGREVHRPPSHIIDECQKLVDAGVREITLLGQTVNHYHYDQAAAVEMAGTLQPQVGRIVKNDGNSFKAAGMNKPVALPQAGAVEAGGFSGLTTFADLLYEIHERVPGVERLRFVTSFPRDFGDDILKVMRDCPRICRYLHLPVQSGSDRILKLMNRGYTVAEYRDLVERARHYLPDCEIASDIICGFPTETEEDHRATAELLKWAQFKNCFIFKYSPRPGTTAIDRFEDDVPEDVKKRRNNELLAVQAEASAAVHGRYVGREVEVFVESISTKAKKEATSAADGRVTLGWAPASQVTQLSGRTMGDLIVMFDGDPALVGQTVRVRVEQATTLALFGQRVAEPAPAPVA